jgi:hypothetical protein
MTDSVDPRLARRRRQVQEASARRRLRWTITLLLLAVTVGLVVAVFQSSWFSVDAISVEGENRAPVLELLGEVGIEPGVSIVSVRAGRAEQRLREDPWIAEAKVRVVWPRSVEVMVVEHVPVAHVTSGASWVVGSSQGTVLATGVDLVEPFIDIDVGALQPGASITDSFVLGALEFVASLPLELKPGTVVEASGTDLNAVVAGHTITLGSPRDMAQKAVTLAVLIEDGLGEGAEVNLVSPLRPAVTNPQPLIETSVEGTTTTSLSS